MKHSSFHFERRYAAATLAATGLALAFWSVLGATVPLALAITLLLLPDSSNRSDATAEIDRLLQKVVAGQLVERLPHAYGKPVLDSIRINLNSMLDQTETAFRETLGGMQAISEGCGFRKLQCAGLHGTFKDVLQKMQVLLDEVDQRLEFSQVHDN